MTLTTDMQGQPASPPVGQGELEDRVISAIVADCADRPGGEQIAARLSATRKLSRELSGVGFFTRYDSGDGPADSLSGVAAVNIVFELTGHGVDHGIPDGLFGGAAYFIGKSDGIDTLEGYTFGSIEWPDDVTDVKVSTWRGEQVQ